MLIISIQRALNLDVDPGAVERMLDNLPSDPRAIEQAVLIAIPYRYDWQVYNVPWYFPTVEEVMERREGDCKARALVLASIFEAKSIPYRVNLSPIHVWIDYEGKQENPIENARVMFLQQDPETGERRFRIPKIKISELMDSFWKSFWKPMPQERRMLLLLGSSTLIATRIWLRNNRVSERKVISFSRTVNYNRGKCQ